MLLAAEAQEVFTIATLEGLFTPTSVPQGVLITTAYFPKYDDRVIGRLKLQGLG